MLNKEQEWKRIEDKRIRKLLPTNYLNSFTVVQPFLCMCASGAAQLTRIEQHWIVVCYIISYILPAVAASRGRAWGLGANAPESEALPPTCPPPPVRRKNGPNQPFSANFWIFAPSELHFAPSMSPHKKNFWCRHCLPEQMIMMIKVKLVLCWFQTSLPLAALPLCRVIIACSFRVAALSGNAALALSPSGIAPKLHRIQLSAICRGGQSGKVID